MADAPKDAEAPIVRENKSSAFRWAIGLVAVLALGVIAWMLTDHRGEPIDPTPQHQPGANQDPAAEPAPPASSGAGTQ